MHLSIFVVHNGRKVWGCWRREGTNLVLNYDEPIRYKTISLFSWQGIKIYTIMLWANFSPFALNPLGYTFYLDNEPITYITDGR